MCGLGEVPSYPDNATVSSRNFSWVAKMVPLGNWKISIFRKLIFILVSEGVIPKAFGYRETFFNVVFEFKEVVMRADD